VVDARAICETCGHTRDWHDRDAVRTRLRSEPPVERPCYREIGGAPCRCNGFRESGTIAVSASSGATRGLAPGFGNMRVAVLALLLVVMALGLLYLYRSQTPSVPSVDLTQALQDISAGRIRAVTIAGTTATLEFRDAPAHKERTNLPELDTVLARAVSDYNATNPSQAIALRYEQGAEPVGVVGSIILSLLPVFLIGGFFYYLLMRARSRS
jgi:hypothetical protein